MAELKKKFVEEIQNLLSRYVEADEVNGFIKKFEAKNSTKNTSKDVINNFYAQQLKIEYSFGQDRMQIDRTITFAQKNLSKEYYLDLLNKLAQLCISYGKLSFAAEILNKLIKQSDSDKEIAESYLLLSDVYSRRANWNKSINALEKANDLFLKSGNQNGNSRCENMLGVIYGEKGNPTEAQIHFERCLDLLSRGEERELVASVESNLGIIKNIQGKYDEALFCFEKALLYFESMNNFRRIAEIRLNIGMLYYSKAEYELALEQIDISICIALDKKLMPVLALSYLSKANLLVAMNEIESALIFADKALEISHLIDDKLSIADIYRTKSLIERKIKNFRQAENYLQSSLRINSNSGNNLNCAEGKKELGELYGDMELKAEKERMLNESLNQYRELNIVDAAKKVESMLSMPSVE
jgi:tetratricopeptide (TPR) repeat protein